MASRGGYIYLSMTVSDRLFINPRRVIEHILGRILRWERLSDRAAFLRQNQIQIGIEQCYRELTACSVKFMVRRP